MRVEQQELCFRGRDRYRPSWRRPAVAALVLALEGGLSLARFGLAGAGWLLGATVLVGGACLVSSRRSRTEVGPAGITICWGFGRGRTHPWDRIRWIDMRETKTRQGTYEAVRITLADGRRRSLPVLQRTALHPNPDLDAHYARVLRWWEANTAPSARFRPPVRPHQRLSPTAVGFVLGIVITFAIVAIALVTQ